MSRSTLTAVSFAWVAIACAAIPARAGDLAEGSIAPPGECAQADELAPPGPLRNPVASLFAPPSGAGSGGGGSTLSGATDQADPGSDRDADADGNSGADDQADAGPGDLDSEDVDVAAGGGPGAGPGSGYPGLPGVPGFDARGPCDQPGSGCGNLGGSRPGYVVPPGGVLLRGGWIRFPDGSLIRAQRAGSTSPTNPDLRSAGGPP